MAGIDKSEGRYSFGSIFPGSDLVSVVVEVGLGVFTV